MNTIKLNIAKFGILLLALVAITSCEYKEIADADFPEGLIYLPAVALSDSAYMINTLPTNPTATNPEGSYRFRLDIDANEFIIPLSVFRSGMSNDASFTIDIKTDRDTVAALIASGDLDSNAEFLPEGKYTLTNSVKMGSGKDHVPFTLTVDLDFLITSAASKTKYALAVNISSDACNSNPNLSTVVILISSEILLSSSDFTYEASKTEPKEIAFTNKSQYATAYSWDFGNGKTSTAQSPVHIFENAGIYEVKLTATGITGSVSEKTETIVIE